jgi:hypothetical protein
LPASGWTGYRPQIRGHELRDGKLLAGRIVGHQAATKELSRGIGKVPLARRCADFTPLCFALKEAPPLGSQVRGERFQWSVVI